MKKVIGLSFAFCLLCFVSIAQDNTNQVADAAKSKTCIPTKECAKKMGLSLAECKAICDKKADSDSKVMSSVVSLTDNTETTSSSDDAASTKQCTGKKGLAKGACKKTCTKSMASDNEGDSDTKVASSVMTNENTAAKTKSCSKKDKKCCAKKAK